MAISITVSPQGTSETEIAQTLRSSRFVDATITAESDDEMDEILSVTAFPLNNEPNIVITPGVTSVNINGRYLDPFSDVLSYVEKGSSDLLETPKVAIGISNLPPNKDFFKLVQDESTERTRSYTVKVTSTLNEETFVVTQKIVNQLDAIKNFIEEYYG